MKAQSKGQLVIGVLLIAIGSLLIIRNLTDIHFGRSYIFPLIIMTLGALFLISIRSREKSGAVIPGTFLFLGGAIILSMNFQPVYAILSNIYPWTFVLILLGISFLILFLIKPKDLGLLVPMTIFLVLGVLFVLYDLWIIEWHSISRFWPFILIIAGTLIVILPFLKNSASTE